MGKSAFWETAESGAFAVGRERSSPNRGNAGKKHGGQGAGNDKSAFWAAMMRVARRDEVRAIRIAYRAQGHPACLLRSACGMFVAGRTWRESLSRHPDLTFALRLLAEAKIEGPWSTTDRRYVAAALEHTGSKAHTRWLACVGAVKAPRKKACEFCGAAGAWTIVTPLAADHHTVCKDDMVILQGLLLAAVDMDLQKAISEMSRLVLCEKRRANGKN